MTSSLDAISIANKIQRKASNPFVSAWVSASAGSGKTKVLTDRVLNLLLCNYAPEKILCLTFTKTAAVEMANRLSFILRQWALLDDASLKAQLVALKGDDFEKDLIPRARKLFACFLEVKGGMKIMTIHSFCEKLLKRFPIEAGLSPSFDVLDEKDAHQYMQRAIQEILKSSSFNQQMELISCYVNEKTFAQLMCSFDDQRDNFKRLLEKHKSSKQLIETIHRVLNVSPFDTKESLVHTIYEGTDFEAFQNYYLTQKNEIRKKLKPEEIDIAKKLLHVLDKIKALQLAKLTTAFLEIGLAVLSSYEKLKSKSGVLDYDDLILQTRQLLVQSNMSEWVLYKLDGGIDHILLDEAQDTSPEQWTIIRQLSEDFFSGESKSDIIRTLFVVGDKKQSIYSFQGADPDEFEKMKTFFKEKIESSKNDFCDIALNISFRSTQAVLDLVNLTLSNPRAVNGVLQKNEEAVHRPARTQEAGLVEVWPLARYEKKETAKDIWKLPVLQNTSVGTSIKLAQQIASHIKEMLQKKEMLLSQNRPIEAGDIMILVQRRNVFVNDLARALKELKIPVAGVDRLVLTEHIAVMDLISLGAFLLLPSDDLALAEILKSPICNLSEEDLFQVAYHRKGSLWDSLKTHFPQLYEKLSEWLNLLDTMNPFELYNVILGSFGIRTAFLKHLGSEANDALDEFLNLALQYEQAHQPSLQGFLKWVKSGKVEIKRDLDQNNIQAVRIMTVHASKGLQSPIVFLPDTCRKPNHSPSLVWVDDIPIWLTKKALIPYSCETFINSYKSLEEKEYNRLLYVALTRAKDRLYICGYENGKASLDGNWYDLVASSLPNYQKDTKTIWACSQEKTVKEDLKQEKYSVHYEYLPDWFNTSAPQEPVPSKPLVPSKPEIEEPALFSPIKNKQALKRGIFIHKLLQLLPSVAPEDRQYILEKTTPMDITLPEHLLDVFEKKELVELFSKESLAEVPVVGNVDNFIVSGQVDRLVVTSNAVLIIDFKTNRAPPVEPKDIPLAYVRQMNMYKSLLKNIFPDKNVKCYLLWIENLTLMEVI